MVDRALPVDAGQQCRCGHVETAAAPFCSACGLALDDSIVLGSSASTTVVDATRTNGIDRRWLGAAVVVIVGFVAWSALSGSTTEEAEQARVPERGASTTTAPQVTSSAPVTSVPTTVVEESVQVRLGDVVVRDVGSDGPLLGEPTGLRAVFLQQPDELSVLDLDSGELVSVRTSFGWLEPFVVSGDWLVARADSSLVALALDDLGGPPVVLMPDVEIDLRSMSTLAFPEPRTDGQVWVAVSSDVAQQFFLVDLATGEVVGVFDPPVGAMPNTWVRHDTDDGDVVLTSIDGGVYITDDDGYRRVVDGRLISHDDDRALVEQCDDRLRCEQVWFDRSTWERVELRLPSSAFSYATFVGGTDWMLLINFFESDERQRLFNVVTGQERTLNDIDHLGFEQQAPPMSPDGRWMAVHDDAALVIMDLATDERHVIDGVGPLGGAIVLTDQAVSIS